MKFVTIRTYNTQFEAVRMKDYLENNGIETFLKDENVVMIYGPFNPFNGIKLQVLEKDIEKSKELLEIFNNNISQIIEEYKGFTKDCPFCHSDNISLKRYTSEKLFLSLFLLGLPLLFPDKIALCYDCLKKWKY